MQNTLQAIKIDAILAAERVPAALRAIQAAKRDGLPGGTAASDGSRGSDVSNPVLATIVANDRLINLELDITRASFEAADALTRLLAAAGRAPGGPTVADGPAVCHGEPDDPCEALAVRTDLGVDRCWKHRKRWQRQRQGSVH